MTSSVSPVCHLIEQKPIKGPQPSHHQPLKMGLVLVLLPPLIVWEPPYQFSNDQKVQSLSKNEILKSIINPGFINPTFSN